MVSTDLKEAYGRAVWAKIGKGKNLDEWDDALPTHPEGRAEDYWPPVDDRFGGVHPVAEVAPEHVPMVVEKCPCGGSHGVVDRYERGLGWRTSCNECR